MYDAAFVASTNLKPVDDTRQLKADGGRWNLRLNILMTFLPPQERKPEIIEAKQSR